MKIKLYRTIIVTVVLCGCETDCLMLEEHRLRVFENGALRKIYGHKKGELRRDWRKLFNEELHDLYLSPYVVQVVRSRVEHIARIWERRTVQGFGWET
jgi:hypothetical protein